MEDIKKTGKICIGIDLGSTNSCLSCMDNGNLVVINNSSGNNTTPSVVAYGEELLIGETAKRQQITNSKNTVYNSKRIIGRDFNDPVIQETIKLVPYDIVKGKAGEALIKVGDKQISPVAVAAEILGKLKKDAEEYFGKEIEDAVVSVPAAFSEMQRKAVLDAGKIAKLNIKRILFEPTAAALSTGNTLDESTVCVYDFGGSTFDCSILEISDEVVEVISTSGNMELGGEDIDNKFLKYIATEFKSTNGVDLTKDSMALQRLKIACEDAKKELSTTKETEINLPFITANENGAQHLNIKVTRAKLEAIAEEFIDKTIVECKKALESANMTTGDIDSVLLVGGSTRIVMVQEKLIDFFGDKLDKSVNPMEAVALGCGIQGAIFTGEVDDLLLLEALPLSLNVTSLGNIATTLIEKNTTIPCSKSQIFSTAEDSQKNVTIEITQGERNMAPDNKLLGRFDLNGIPPAPRGVPQIEVKFDVDANSILTVSAKDLGTGKEQAIKIESSSGLSEEEIEKMKKDAELHAEEDKKKKELVEIKNQAESTIHQIEKSMKDNEDKVTDDLKEPVKKAIEELKNNLTSDDKDVIMDAINKVNESFHKIAEVIYKQPEQNTAEGCSEAGCDCGTKEQTADVNQEDVVDADFEEVKKE